MRKAEVIKKIIALLVSVVAVTLAVGLPHLVPSAADGRRVVVLDAGHGGSDAGVMGVRTGVKESDLNLRLAKLLGEYLESEGVGVVYTRTADIMHGYPGIVGNKKRADLFKRGDIINKARPDAVISIHMNFYTSSSRRGAQVFYANGSEGGKALAETLQDALNENINVFNGGRRYSALTAEKYLLECSPYPTAIAECGFLSNPLDEANLCDAGYQSMLAEVLAKAILTFLYATGGSDTNLSAQGYLP